MLSEDISEGARELFLTHNPGAQTFVTTVIKVRFFLENYSFNCLGQYILAFIKKSK